MIKKWKASHNPPDDKEICRRLIDLFLVSVLLDAGAGNVWKYKEPSTNMTFSRSEGLGVASANMFENGVFSGIDGQPFRVNGTLGWQLIFAMSFTHDVAVGLARISASSIGAAMQVTEENPMAGLEGRTNLLSNLANALRKNAIYFGDEGRPGNLVGTCFAKFGRASYLMSFKL